MRASIKYLIGICTAFTLSTCTNRYADFNTDPTQPTENMLQRDYYQLGTFFIQMQKNVIPAGSNGTDEVNQYQLTDNLQGDIYSGIYGSQQQLEWRTKQLYLRINSRVVRRNV